MFWQRAQHWDINILKWNQVTKFIPKDDTSYLIYYLGNWYIGTSTVYSKRNWTHYSNMSETVHTARIGDFYIDFNTRLYFDNPHVYWTELPKMPRNINKNFIK